MVILFDILFFVFAVCFLPVLLLKGKLRREWFRRLGAVPPEIMARCAAGGTVWVHAVSVGEVQAVLGLVGRIQSSYPGRPVILTTVTPAGYQLARSKLGQGAMVLYAPLDLSWVVRRYIRRLAPALYISVETEIWPNLWSALNRNHIPIVVFNGRISGTSFRRYRAARLLLRRILAGVSAFCMQTDDDARRVEALGADPARVRVTGNVKFDAAGVLSGYERGAFGYVPEDLLLVAGSTHPGEEEIMVRLYGRMRREFPRLRLLIAPRHVERYAAVAELVRREGFRPVPLSEKDPSPADGDMVVVVDTIGHLLKLYAMATVVFVGKSLTAHGGQNIIEPALFAKPIIVGPYMENFQSICEIFSQEQAVVRVETPPALEPVLRRLFADPSEREALGQKALEVVRARQGATTASFEVIRSILPQ